ncbi:MAG: 30S ribosomal protein S4 [SAR324 cluster bacterium]|uniref:Small ribosomal subunit protein uS4 n=1 Tax=SAR324 cluster bacterium TaxID=2024889 RepID=A0A2A4T4V7_9DELT|nr:MAG: 30S ribosomal protein S4 [SAR324 cluster bacterium]
MARYTGAVCRLCRREKVKLFLKGDRCHTDKCAIEKRAYVPGQHGPNARRVKHSEYGIQLREKQKVKRIYGLLEKQFRLTFKKAERQKGKTGENLLVLLERRLDNVVLKMGFARSLAEARQLVKHSHVELNGKKANIPSALVNINDQISIRQKSRGMDKIKVSVESSTRKGVPAWVSLNDSDLEGKLVAYPKREEIAIAIPIQEQLIVELYSR